MSTLEKNELSQVELKCLSENINQLMHEKKIDTKQLSAFTGISASSINAMKRGTGNPTLGTLITLTNFFDVTLDTLVLPNHKKKGTVTAIPVYDLRVAHEIKKHHPIKNIHLKIEEEDLFQFAVSIHNSSLMPFFEKGSLLLISHQKKCMDGDMALLRINNECNVFRRVFLKNKGHLFQYISLETDLHHFDHYKIIGPVLKVIHNMRISDE